MVDTDLLNAFDATIYAQLPKLKPEDVTAAVLYALSTSERAQVKNEKYNESKIRCIDN